MKKEAMNLKESIKGFMSGFGGKVREGKMLKSKHNVKNKQSGGQGSRDWMVLRPEDQWYPGLPLTFSCPPPALVCESCLLCF